MYIHVHVLYIYIRTHASLEMNAVMMGSLEAAGGGRSLLSWAPVVRPWRRHLS